MNKPILAAIASSFMLTAPAPADELQDARTLACDRIKACAMEKTGLNDMDPGMKILIEAMMTGTCTAVINRYIPKSQDQESYDRAVACMLSMEKMSCEDIDNPEGEPTPECQAFTNPNMPAPQPDAPEDGVEAPVDQDSPEAEEWTPPQ